MIGRLPRRAWRLLVFLVVLEVRMYVGLLRLVTRRHDVPPGASAHPYVGAVSALLWGFTAVSAVELVVLHVVLPWERVRLVADVLGIWGVVWCAGLTGCHYVYPHLVTDEALRVRDARRTDAVTIPWSQVASVSGGERSVDKQQAADLRAAGTHCVAVADRTNVSVRLTTPLTVVVKGREHVVHEVRLFADEARAFVVEARARAGCGAPGRS